MAKHWAARGVFRSRFAIEVVRGQAKADDNDHPAHHGRAQGERTASARVTAQNRRRGHRQSVLPHDQIARDEQERCAAVDAQGQHGLQCVDAVDAPQPKEG